MKFPGGVAKGFMLPRVARPAFRLTTIMPGGSEAAGDLDSTTVLDLDWDRPVDGLVGCGPRFRAFMT